MTIEDGKLNCDNCRKDFEGLSFHRGGRVSPRRRAFCSTYCFQSFYNKKYRIKNQVPIVAVNCMFCGNEFMPKRRGQRSCSIACNNGIQKLKAKEKRQERRPLSSICQSESCKKEFSPKDGVWSSQKFCSKNCYRRECQNRYRARHPERCLLAERKRKWGGNWFKAMERDSWTCQLCGSTKREELIVHHLDGEGESGAKNHTLDNLQVLCGSCHHTRAHGHTTFLRINGKLYVRIGDKQMEVVE